MIVGLNVAPSAGRLVGELLHPVVVHAAGRRVGCEAGAEVLRDHAAQRQRQRQADEQRHSPDAREDAPARGSRGAMPSRHAASDAHTSAAHDSRQSCSQTIHFSDHFVAAAGPSRRERLRVVRVVHVEQQHAIRIDLRPTTTAPAGS